MSTESVPPNNRYRKRTRQCIGQAWRWSLAAHPQWLVKRYEKGWP